MPRGRRNSGGQGSGLFDAGLSAQSDAEARIRYERAAAAAQEEAEQDDDSGGILGSLKNIGGSILGALDTGRAFVTAVGMEGMDLLSEGGQGSVQDTDKVQQTGTSWSDIMANTRNRVGFGDYMEADEDMQDQNKWVKRAGGLLGDVAFDPLTYVTLGTGSVAKSGIQKAGQILGDDVARAAARGGSEGLRRALQEAGGPSLEELLARGTAEGLSRTGRNRVADTIQALDRNGRGGIGVAGFRTGLGQRSAQRLLDTARTSDTGRAMRSMLVPTARVADEFGQGAAGAVDAGISSAANARRLLPDREEALKTLDMTDSQYDDLAKTTVRDAMTAELRDLAPELVSDTPRPGWVAFKPEVKKSMNSKVTGMKFARSEPGVYVPEVVARALKDSVSTPPSALGKTIAEATSWLKRMTTLGPLNAFPHVTRNMFSNHLFAAMYGGVKSPALYDESRKLRKALKAAFDSGEITEASLKAAGGLDDLAAKRALALHSQGLTGRGAHAFEDVGDIAVAKGKKEPLGTRTASRINSWHEELSRGAVFLQGLDDGLSPAMAAKKSRDAMLDYSQAGLTKAERDMISKVVFFYKFPRRAIPAGVKFAIEHPGQASVLSKAGLGVAQGTRNEYGEKIGLYADTPLEAAFGATRDAVMDPMGSLLPPLQSVLDPDKRNWRDALPPVDKAMRVAEEGFGTATGPTTKLGGVPVPLPGFRRGKNYSDADGDGKLSQAEKEAEFALDLQLRLDAGLEPTPTQRLTQIAIELGVENAAGKTRGSLLNELSLLGLSDQELAEIERPPTKQRALL